MIIFTPIFEPNTKIEPSFPKYDGVKMSLEMYLSHKFEEANFKYEWNNGVLGSEEKWKPREAIIYKNIRNQFVKNCPGEKYEILTEINCYLFSQKKIRIPDIGIFLYEDLKNYTTGNSLVPVLAIEIISPSNQAEELELKINEYFQEGVKSVWCIYPNLKQIKVYHSLKQIIIYNSSDTCEFKNSDLNFSITVNEVFQDFS